jgi:hypothetical protein
MSKPETRNYSYPSDKIFNAALKTVRDLGYKIDNLDKANGLLNFKTGMSWKSWARQEMSILILDNGDHTCSIDISGRRNPNGAILQVYDWGEAGSIATKVFEGVEERLDKPPSGEKPKDDKIYEYKCPKCKLKSFYQPSKDRKEKPCPICPSCAYLFSDADKPIQVK